MASIRLVGQAPPAPWPVLHFSTPRLRGLLHPAALTVVLLTERLPAEHAALPVPGSRAPACEVSRPNETIASIVLPRQLRHRPDTHNEANHSVDESRSTLLGLKGPRHGARRRPPSIRRAILWAIRAALRLATPPS